MSLVDRIESIEHEINKTQRNKNTEHHIGRLKAKLSTLRRDLITASSKGSKGGGSGFDVAKTGHARVGMIGFPSVGKSTLLVALTEAKSEVASYEFTTLTAIPGTFNHKGAKVQLVDLPGIIEGAKDNKGRGRQVIATARTADLLLIMLDSTKPVGLKRKVEKELFGFGIRLNQTPPDISYRQIDRGGILLSSPCRDGLKYLSQDTVEVVCREMKINHADICVRDVNCTVDDLIDAIEGNRVYMPALYVMNKIDAVTIEELDLFDQLPNWIPISAHKDWNLDELKDAIWSKLSLCRVYTKKKGMPIDYEPVILRRRRGPTTVEMFCNDIHRDMMRTFKYAFVWGTSVRHQPQRVGKDHVLEDEDVVTIVGA